MTDTPPLRHILLGYDEQTRRGQCSVCGPIGVKPAKHRSGNVTWLCRTAARGTWKPKKKTSQQNLAKKLWQLYKLTMEQYEKMHADQGGVCAICGKPPTTEKRRLAVDHDHQTGRVRGLLCIGCNRSLGQLGDSETSIRRVLAYLCPE